MASRKTTKKVVKKSPRSHLSSRSVSSRSSQGFFNKHKNLKWMLPLFVVLFIAFLVVHHYIDESSLTEGTWKSDVKNSIKQQVQSTLHIGGDDGTEAVLTVTPTPSDNTITPYITVTPTQGY